MRTVGAGAINQAMKAIIIAKGFLAPIGIDIVCIPAFTEIETDGNTITGIKLVVKVEDWNGPTRYFKKNKYYKC